MARKSSSATIGSKNKKAAGGLHAKKEPADKNSIEHVIWELEPINAERRKQGKAPLSYGKYVSMRDRK